MYFIGYPVLSCEQNKAIWLANVLMNYYSNEFEIVLYCIVLYCIVLYCIVLYCIVLY
jgi:hypothetical protein